MRARMLAAVFVALALAGGLCAAASYVFCSSWYAEEALRELFSSDDAAFVELLAAVGVLSGAVASIGLWRGPGGVLVRGMVVVVMMLAAVQLVMLESRSMCVSLPGALEGGQIMMRAEPQG